MTTSMDQAAEAIREQITSMMKSFNLPNVDMPAFIESQKRNIDAMSKAAQMTNEADRKSTRLNSSHITPSRMPSSA